MTTRPCSRYLPPHARTQGMLRRQLTQVSVQTSPSTPLPAPRAPHPPSRLPHPAPPIPHPASRLPPPASRIPPPASRLPPPASRLSTRPHRRSPSRSFADLPAARCDRYRSALGANI